MRVLPKTLFLSLLLIATACGPIKKEASYPDRIDGDDKILYSDQKRDTIWGEGETIGSKLFGDKEAKDSAGGGIGVNSFLWRASLDTISFMPISSVDPFGGVILTDWYENPDVAGERYKANIYILDKQLRADGVRVAVFKQVKNGQRAQGDKDWRDAPVPAKMATDIENTILTRARELRVSQAGRK